MFFLLLQDPIQATALDLVIRTPLAPLTVTVSQTFLDTGNLTVLSSPCQVFYKLFFNLGLSDVFLVVRPGLWILGKKSIKVKCHSRK